MGTEQSLAHRLVETARRGRGITLLLGSGVTAEAVPGVGRMLDLADEFVSQALQNPDLSAALANLRTANAGEAGELYASYRRAFAEWLSPVEFDIVVQRATLEAYRPTGTAPPTWERIGYHRGVSLESELESWRLPAGIAALGQLLAKWPDRFSRRVLTTNFDPLIEVAVRRAGGVAHSLPLERDGSFPALLADEGAVDVVHLHGYWRPTSETAERSLLHDPEQLRARRGTLTRELAGLLRDETVCVVGYSGWDDVFTHALGNLVTAGQVDVLWAVHGERTAGAAAPPPSADRTLVYHDVHSDRLFPAVQRALSAVPGRSAAAARPVAVAPTDADARAAGDDPPATPRTGTSGHRVHRPALESALGIRPSADELIRQLDHEFRWRLDRIPGTALKVLFWPVRLRPPTLIYAVQAIVAAALSARRVRVVLCFDDLAGHPHADEWRAMFTSEVRRWFGLVDGAHPPEVDSLASFCSAGRVAERLLDPDRLLRPTHPWAVELEYYGGERTVYDVVRAAKALPDADEADADDAMIGASIRTTRAERLMSTPAIWAYLHDLLGDTRADAVLTLGGDDEATMWRQWHDTFPEPVGHLYNPVLHHVRQDAQMLRARDFLEVERHLRSALNLDTWQREGHYLHWTVQNAVLLAQYLRNRPPLRVDGRFLDSWEATTLSISDTRRRAGTLSAIAREVAALLSHDFG